MVLSIGLAGITALLTIWVGSPSFALSNDELAMSLSADGSMTGTPSPHLVFVSELIGYPLSWLYSMVPELGWLSIALLLTNLLSVLAVAWVVRSSGAWVKVTWVLTALPAIWILTEYPNYTMTGILAVSMGVALGALGELRWTTVLSASALTTVGVLWRAESLVAGLLLCSLAVSWSVFQRGRAWWRMGVVVTSLVVAKLVALLGRPCTLTSGEECSAWHYYEQFNAARHAIHNSVRADVLYGLVGQEIGWSRSTADLFRAFLSFDHPMFREPVIAADSLLPALLQLQGGGVLAHLSSVAAAFQPYAGWIALWLLASVTAVLMSAPRGCWRRWLVALGAALLGALLAAATAALVRLPERVVLGLTVALALLMVLLIADLPRPAVTRSRRWAVLAAGVLTLVVGVVLTGPRGVSAVVSANSDYRSTRLALLDALRPYGASTLVAPGWYLGEFSISPYQSTPRNVRQILPVFSGWQVFSPDWEALKKRRGLATDVYSGLLGGSHAEGDSSDRVLMLSNQYAAQLTADFIVDDLHLAPQITLREVAHLTPTLSLWEFESSSKSTDTG